MDNCIFTTHTTLTKNQAISSLSSLFKNNNLLYWDNFVIYNTHPEEISNSWLKEQIEILDRNKQIRNLLIYDYDLSCQKTLTKDFYNQLKFLFENSNLEKGKTLFLKSDYCLSENFNVVYKTLDLQKGIWCLPIYNAKSKVKQEEIDELLKLEKFDPLYKNITYYRGGNNYPHTPDGEVSPDGILLDTDSEIRFVSHNVQADYNVPIITNNLIETSLKVASQVFDMGIVWGGTENFFRQMFSLEGVEKCSNITAFAVHTYHSIFSKNSNTNRTDLRKEIKGEEY